MPEIWKEWGYSIFFWSNENGEPIHFHVSKGKKSENSPKFWLYSNGDIVPDKDYTKRLKANDLKRITGLAKNYQFKNTLINEWVNRFGYVSFKE